MTPKPKSSKRVGFGEDQIHEYQTLRASTPDKHTFPLQRWLRTPQGSPDKLTACDRKTVNEYLKVQESASGAKVNHCEYDRMNQTLRPYLKKDYKNVEDWVSTMKCGKVHEIEH